jgi:cyclophilin family peptidyl-prolyl cis-trans isomerase
MQHFRHLLSKKASRGFKTVLVALLIIACSFGFSARAWAGEKRASIMPQGNAITDGSALLRYALPIDNYPIREVQSSLEDIGNHIRSKRWGPINSDLGKASRVLSSRRDEILASIPEDRKSDGEALLTEITEGVNQLRQAVEAKDREQVIPIKGEVLTKVGQIEKLMVKGFPFEVPEEYANLPQLKGRATIEMETDKGNITLVVDGYSAPVSAGNFVDLVERRFYNGLEFTRSEESYVLQAGDPPGPEVGFVNPDTGRYRNIPLEVLVKGDKLPTYGITLEDAGRYRDEPVLPFSAYGAIAMARSENDPNNASSQFFFFLFEPELTPAGLNLLDGRYAVFGYVTKGTDVLRELRQGDKIISAKVVEGAGNLVQPTAS